MKEMGHAKVSMTEKYADFEISELRHDFPTLLDLPKAGDNQFQCPGFGVSLALGGSAESVVWSPDNNINRLPFDYQNFV